MCFISYIYCTILWEFTQYILHDLLSKLEPYTTCVVADTPAPFSKELSVSQALNFLRLRGYVIKDDVPVGAIT